MMAAANPDSRPMLDHALEYLSLGYPVLPVCSPRMGAHQHRVAGRMQACPPDKRGKTPMTSWKDYQSRLPTVDDVRAWWTRWPTANIGMATGALSGVIVLDCDSGEARQLALEKGGLEKAPAVWTGTPGGIHFWIGHPGYPVRNFVKDIPGTDFRGDGGYVLLPPSLHHRGANYRWNEHTLGMRPPDPPEWLSALLQTKAAPEATGAWDGAALNVDEALGGFSEGERDTGLFKLACRFRHDDQPQAYAEILIAQAARNCRPPFDVAEAVSKVRYVYERYDAGGVGPTVNEDGWFSPEASQEAPAGVIPSTEARYPIQSLSDLLLVIDDDPAQIVDGVLWPNRVTWVFSDPSSGKTIFLLAALMHVAAGRPFCGRSVKQMPVLIIEEDSPLSVIGDYVIDLCEIYDFDLGTLPIWINKVQGLRITNDEGAAVVREALDFCPERPGVVLFDACERMVPSDKFSTKELDPLTKVLQRLIGEKITPIIIDHTNKSKPEKGREEEFKADPVARLYGARAKSAISDVMIYFDGFLKNGSVQLVFAKFRGETPPPIVMRFDSTEGFAIEETPLTARNEKERMVIRFFNNAPHEEYSVADIEASVSIKRRTLERVLSILVKRRWLLSSGSTRDRRFRANPLAGSF